MTVQAAPTSILAPVRWNASVPQTLVSKECVWSTTPFDAWDADFCFSAADPSFFCIVQSNSGIEAARIWNRVRPYIEAGAPHPNAPAS